MSRQLDSELYVCQGCGGNEFVETDQQTRTQDGDLRYAVECERCRTQTWVPPEEVRYYV